MADGLHLSPRHRSVLEAVLHEHLPGVEAWAYGSRVNGRSHDGSDLDLVLRAPELTKIPAEQLADFKDAVCDSEIPFLVEARDWARLPEQFQREIERNHVPISDDVEPARQPHSQWSTATIGDIAEKIGMGPFGSSIKVETFVADGVPIISGQHLHGPRVDDTPGFNFITEEHATKLANANVRRGDIIFTHAGNIGQAAFVSSRSAFERYVISQRQFYMRCDQSKVVPEFVTAYFRSPDGRHSLLANASQVGVPSIAQPVTYLRTLDIPLPPLSEQRAIAGILGALDDKIELNRRMNETLEAMARALFNSWFVDFEPVRAKMERRDTGLPTSIGSLFPNVLDNRGMPEGWALGPLSRIADSPRRGIDPSDVAEDTPYIGLEHMPRRSIALADWEGAGKVKSTKSIFKKGDILFGKLRPYFHKVGVASLDGICSTDIVVVSPRSPQWAVFCLACLSTDEFVEYTDQTSTGTKMPRTSWKTMSQYETCLPPTQVAREFQRLLQPMIHRLNVNVHESRRLARTRNVLLPKLVSGELRVGDI